MFLDYNQNARDRTVASAYSVRPMPDARVSCPLAWDEVPDVEAAELRIDTVPERLKDKGDPSAGMDADVGSFRAAVGSSPARRGGGLGDAPWPPHFAKQKGEPKRVQPSRAKKAPKKRTG